MTRWNDSGKVNIRALVILALVLAVLAGSMAAVYKIRKAVIAKSALAAGNAAYDSGRYDVAAKEYPRYLERNPWDLQILRRFAESCLWMQPLDAVGMARALEAYRRIVRREPANEEAYVRMADLDLSRGEYDDLRHIARLRLENAPDDPRPVLWMAQAQMEQPGTAGDDTVAPSLEALVTRIEDTQQKIPEHAKACRLLARWALHGSEGSATDRARLGRQWADRAVTYQPQCAAARIFRAQFLQANRDSLALTAEQLSAAATEDLTQAASLEIGDPSDWLTLSEVWTLLDQYEPAEAALKRAAAADKAMLWKYGSDADVWRTNLFAQTVRLGVRSGKPQDALALAPSMLERTHRARYRLRVLEYAVKLYAQTGNAAEARRCIDTYVEAISQSPNAAAILGDPRVVFLRVIVLRVEDRPDKWPEIIKLLHPLLTTQSAPPELHGLLGEAYSNTHQVRLAIRELTTYLGLLNQQGQAPGAQLLQELVAAHRQRGDLPSALYYARQLEQVPGAAVEFKLQRIELEIAATDGRRDVKSAERLAQLRQEVQAVRRQAGDSPSLAILESQACASAGQLDQAEALLAQAAATDPSPESRMQLITLLVRQGKDRRSDAIEQCRQLIKTRPELAGGYLALSRLLEEQGDLAEARRSLEQGLEAAPAAMEKRGLAVQLALLDMRHDQRSDGMARLEKLRRQDKQDFLLRALMLEVSDIQRERATIDSLIEEIKAIQGDAGVVWKYYRAKLLLSQSDWRDQRDAIEPLLQACRTSDLDWVAPTLLLGELNEREGRVDAAVVCYQTALKDNPGSAELADRLVHLLESLKRYADAMAVLDRLVGADPRRVADLRIRLAISGGDGAAAVQELRRRIAADPRDARSRVLLAQLLYSQDRLADAAVKLLEQAREIDPSSLVPTAAQIGILRSAGRSAEIPALLDREVARQDGFETRLMRGTYLSRIGGIEQADADFLKLPGLNSQGDGQVMLAQHYLRTGRITEAKTVLAEGIATYPANTALKEQSVRLALDSPQAQERQNGLTLLESLLAEQPDNLALRVIQARALLGPGHAQEAQKAETILRDVARRYPLMLEAHLALAQAMGERGDFAAMQQVVNDALRSNGDNVPLLLLLAEAQDNMGNDAGARQTAALAMRVAPLSGSARAYGVQFALRHGDKRYLTEQFAALRDVLAISADDEDLQLTNAVALEGLDRANEAASALEAFAKTAAGARSPNVQLALCRLHRQAGRVEAAQQCLAKAGAMGGDLRQLLAERMLLLGAQGRYDQVLEVINGLPADWTVDDRVVQTAALVLGSSGKPEYRQAARAWYTRLTQTAEALPVRYRLANLIYTDGDTATALGLYEDLCREAPDHPNVLNDLAWILANDKGEEQIARAVELSSRAVAVNPGDANLRHTRAFALSRSRRTADWVEGAQEYERFINMTRERPADQARGLAEMGLLLVRLDRKDSARTTLAEALRLDGQSATLPQSLRQQVQDALAALK